MDKTYKRHSFTKLWIATAMFIFCCFATSAFAQEAVDADTFMTTTETITEVKTTPEIAETATASAETTPDTIGELALRIEYSLDAACGNARILCSRGLHWLRRVLPESRIPPTF